MIPQDSPSCYHSAKCNLLVVLIHLYNRSFGALADLGLARAYTLHDTQKKLWKNDDLDSPILHQARAEYVKLH